MEKGTLSIIKTKKGFAATIFYENKGGKSVKLPITFYRFQDDKLNETACTFLREGGTISKLIDKDGCVLYDANKKEFKGTTPQNNSQNTNQLADSLDIYKTQLPKDTRALIVGDIENFALKLNKAPRFENNKFYFFKKERRGDNYQLRADFSKIKFNEICERQNKQVDALFEENNVKIIVKPQWRWVSGLGGESVYETGMALHHIYGFPYLSASAIKGVLRSFLITEIWGTDKNTEEEAFKESKLMCDLFGCPKDFGKPHPSYYKEKYEEDEEKYKNNKSKYRYGFKERKGVLTFFDFYPQSEPNIEVDIMNPHYMEYYGSNGRNAPTDFQLPIPIPFLVVGNHSNFQTFVGTKSNLKLSNWTGEKCIELIQKAGLTNDNTLIELVEFWLKKALTEHGIGAKTAVGYGYFSE